MYKVRLIEYNIFLTTKKISADTMYYEQIRGFEWQYKTNARLTGSPLTNTVYDNREKAILTCTRTAACKGVSQISE